MKKFLKIIGILAAVIIVCLYIAFLFVLPKAVDLNKFKPDLQKIVKEQTNLNLEFENPQIVVTPLLSAGVKADNIKIKLDDGSEVISADSVKTGIALPSLLFLTVKVSIAEIENPIINIDIVDGKAYKAVQAYEDILNKKEESINENIQTEQKPFIDASMIKILVPKVLIKNYVASINDLKTGNSLKLKGDELKLGYRNGKTAYINTDSALYVNDNKNIDLNIFIDSFLPEPVVLDEEDDKAQRVTIPFVNPVEMYMAYDLKTNINSKIKIRKRDNQIVSNGFLNIDNFTLKLSDMNLPESKLHLITHGTKADIDSELFITNNEKLSIDGMLNYGKKPSSDIKITSNQIFIDDVLNLVKATLDAVHIKHELAPLKGEGFFTVDTYIKTNFKKLVSNGNIKINNCIIKNVKKNQKLAKINSVISLDNSVLKFVNTVVEIADTLFKINGTVDEKSYVDISFIMEKLPLKNVFNLFMPSEINDVYNVNSGDINLKADIEGELKKVLADFNLSVNNVNLFDKINNINYSDKQLKADFNTDFKTVTGKIDNSGFKLSLNNSAAICDKLLINIEEKDITIPSSQLKINNKSVINFEGQIKNYIKKPDFYFNAAGNILANDLKRFLPQDLDIFIKEKGSLPVSVNLTGDKNKQTLSASIEADKDNYITPVDIKNVENQNTTLQTVVDFKGDRLKIKNTGFFIKTVSQNPDKPEEQIITLKDIISLDGTITKLDTSSPNINLIKIKMPNEITGNIYAFPQSGFKAKGNMFIFGELNSPRIRGDFNIRDIDIPELFISVSNIMSKFEGKDLNIDVKEVNANGSDFNILINADLSPSKYFVIKSLNLISNLTDVDNLMKVSDALMKYMPQPSASPSKNAPQTQADIPVILSDGGIDIKQIKTGNIILSDTTGKIALLNNIFYVNNLLTSAFKGKIRGDVSLNLLSGEIMAALKGNGLDVEKTLLDCANLKDTLSGTMDFDTNISLKGSTYEEQVKSLKGSVNFLMKNGTLGPFGKLENLIMAENIRESEFFKSTIGSVLNSLLSFDTTHYNLLSGHLTFNNGLVDINPIKSEGNIMSTFIFGDFDVLENKIDIKLRGRLGSQLSESMGPLALLNPINLVKATPGMSLILGKIFFLFTEVVTDSEMNEIPSLGKDINDNNSTKFQIVVRGDVAKPLTLVKSFKWLALQSDMDMANAFLSSIPQDTIPLDLNGNPIVQDAQGSAAGKTDIEVQSDNKKFSKIKDIFKKKKNNQDENVQKSSVSKIKDFFLKIFKHSEVSE